MTLLLVKDLSIAFKGNRQLRHAIQGLTFAIEEKETLALVGESGCGKTLTALSLLRLLPNRCVIYPKGDILFANKSLLKASEREMQQIRGNTISMIFQDPFTALNPLQTIGKQLHEVLTIHKNHDNKTQRLEIIQCLERVGIRHASQRLANYPHQFSGGERQRIMIAMAIITKPKLLIADEPTTALDALVQSQIVTLLHELKSELGMSLLFITHNLPLVKKIADNVAVMKQGQLIECNNRHRLFLKPQHDYTRLLLDSEPSGDPVPRPPQAAILMTVNQLTVDIATTNRFFHNEKKRIIDNISLSLYQGESIGLIGESGCGKSTTALAIVKLIRSQGRISFDGHRLDKLSDKKWRPFRKQIQIIFQNTAASLNPRWRVKEIISEGLITHKIGCQKQIDTEVVAIMQEVGLDPSDRYRYIHEFSGGEQQRIAIARALVLKPQLVILDEPTSSLDRPIQGQIINLLKSLQQKYQLSYLFISHDLSLIRTLCHQVLIMHEGKIIEQGTRDQIFHSPSKTYTRQLIAQAAKRPLTVNRNNDSTSSNKNWSNALLLGQKRS